MKVLFDDKTIRRIVESVLSMVLHVITQLYSKQIVITLFLTYS